MMRTSTSIRTLVVASVALIAVGIVDAAGLGIDAIRDQPPHDAGLAMLVEAYRLVDQDPSSALAAARIDYLAGDRAKATTVFERALRKQDADDLQDIGEIYAEAGDAERADALFQRVIALEPKDDRGQMEMAAWYIRLGRREQGEALFGRALARSPARAQHYLRAAEAYLDVPKGR